MTMPHATATRWHFFAYDSDQSWDWSNHVPTYGLAFVGFGERADDALGEALAAQREDLTTFLADHFPGAHGVLAAIRAEGIETVTLTVPERAHPQLDALVAHARALGLRSEDLDESILDLEHDDARARVNETGGPLGPAFDHEHDAADAAGAHVNQAGLEEQVARLVDGYGPEQARAHMTALAASPLRVLAHVAPATAAWRARRAA